MNGLDTGKDKVKKICDILRRETLEPAKAEADLIIEDARREAEALLKEARRQAEEMQEETKVDIQRQQSIFQSSLNQAFKQSFEILKQKIENNLFNKELGRLIKERMQNPNVIAEIITAAVRGIEKEGIEADLSVYIPAAIPAKTINALLAKEILDKLKEKSVLLTEIGGGIQLKIHQDNITLDISDAALTELVANYIRKDFRDMIFQK